MGMVVVLLVVVLLVVVVGSSVTIELVRVGRSYDGRAGLVLLVLDAAEAASGGQMSAGSGRNTRDGGAVRRGGRSVPTTVRSDDAGGGGSRRCFDAEPLVVVAAAVVERMATHVHVRRVHVCAGGSRRRVGLEGLCCVWVGSAAMEKSGDLFVRRAYFGLA